MGLIKILQERFPYPLLRFSIIEMHEIQTLSKVEVGLQDRTITFIFVNLLKMTLEEVLSHLGETSLAIRQQEVKATTPRKKHTLADIILKFKVIHGVEKYSYVDIMSQYQESDIVKLGTKVWIKCLVHNHYFKQTVNNHLLSSGYSCPICLEEYNKSVMRKS